MLRALVLLLVLANGLYYAWSQEWLAAWGFAPARQNEPQRMAQQVQPDRVRLLSPEEVRRLESNGLAALQRPPECLVAGLFDEAQSAALRKALEPALPSGSWVIENAVEPARWLVYMGRFTVPENLARKQLELKTLNVRHEPVSAGPLSPGLALGEFPTEAAANRALASLTERGIRSARVVRDRPEARGQRLRLPQADAALRARLEEFGALLAGKSLRACG